MPSKISCFNGTLFRKNLTRFWPMWAMASFLGALAPLAILMRLIQDQFAYKASPAEVAQVLYNALCYGAPVFLLAYCALCALAVWSFLYSSRSVGLLHTLPITRKGIFLTNFLSGMAMVLIPFAVVGILSIPVSALAGGFNPTAFGVTILGVLGMALFYYGSATAVVFVTGNVFAMPVLYGLVHFLAVLLDFLVSILACGFYFGYDQEYAGAVEWLSPTVYMMRNLGVCNEYQEVVMTGELSGETWTSQELVSSTLERGWIIAVYALVGLVLLAAAWLLYRRRRSECAGDVVAVGWMKPLFRYGVALCSAAAGGQLLYAFFWSTYQKDSLYDVVPLIICMVIAGLIGYYAASMLLAKSLRVFRRSAPGALAVAAACVALCLCCRADVLGVENRVPDAGAVESVNFYISGEKWCDGTVSDPAAIHSFLTAHRAILDEKEAFLRNERERDYERFVQVRLTYFLTDGSEMERRYNLYYLETDPETPGSAVSALAELVTEPAVQRANLLYDEDQMVAITGGEFLRYDRETANMVSKQLDAQQARQLYDALVRDVEAGHFGHTFFRKDTRDTETYYGDLTIYYTLRNDNGDTYTQGKSVNFSVYCEEILQTLEDLELVNDRYGLRTYAQIYASDQTEVYNGYYEYLEKEATEYVD